MKQVTWPLRFIIPAIIMVTCGAALTVLAAFGVWGEYHNIESQMAKHVRFEMELLGNSLERFYREDNQEALLGAVASAAVDEEVKHILLLDENDRIAASNRYEITGKTLKEAGISVEGKLVRDARMSRAAFQAFSKDRQELHSANYVVLGVRPGEIKPSRVGVLYEVHDMSGLKGRAARQAMNLIVPLGIILAGMAAIFWILFDRMISRRLSHLLAVSDDLAKGSYSSRTILTWGDEIGRLANAFNTMADSIQNNLATIKRQGEQLELSVRGSNLGVWDWRIPEGTVSHNPQWCRLLGLDDSYLVHPLKAFSERLHEEDREKVMHRIQACLDGKGRYESEHRILHADGHYLWVMDRGEVVERDTQGRALRMVGSFADISVMKMAEDALRASKRKFMQFFTMLPVALGVVNRDGVITEFNARFTGIFGYTVEDIPTINEWWLRAYPDESYRRQVLETWGNALAKAAKEGTDIEPLEYKVTCKNGAERFVMIGGIMLDGDVLATFVDVTERKRAEKALFESESRYRLMSEASFEGIVINIEGKVVDCNDAFARMFGYTPEEIIGKVPFDLAPPESHAIIMDHIRRESEEMYDVVARKKDGTLFNIEMRGRSIMHHGVKARITAMRDITGRVKAERAIRESEERLRATFDSSGIGMVFADLHGRFERVNAALCRMLGHGAQDLIGKSCQEVTHPDDRHIGAGWLRKVASGQSDKQQIEERFIRKNGGVIWCSVAASVIKDAHGIPLHIFSTVIDITERKRAEDKLRHSEEDLRKAQEIAHVGNWNWDILNDELRWSDEIYRIFGVVPSEFGATYEAFLSYVHPDDRAYVQQSVNDAIAKRSAYDINHRIVAADGGVRMVHEVGEVAYGETGAAVSMVGVVQDITELKKAEQALAESENKYRALVEETSDWVWAVDEKGVFTYSSPQVREITGYGAEEVSGKSPFAFMAPEEGRRAAEFFHATAATQQSFRSFEHSTIHRDGRSVFIETSGVPCFDAEGRFAGYRGINRDITQRKAAEEVLRKSSQLLDAIIENIPNMIFLKRASDLRFELFNRAGEALVGHGRRELLGRNDYDFFPKDQADFFTAKDRETLERSDITDILEEPIKTPSGTRILHTKKLTLRNERGEPEYLLGISEDITERKAAEDELYRAKEAAEEATRLKDKFISLVSHDLKTPLASMIGFLRLVRHDHGEPLSDGAKLILDRAMESGDAMVHLIEDLLTISRFKTGQLKLNRQFFDAEYLGAMVVANLAHLAQVKGIVMESTIPANYRIYGDKTLLAEAMQNLVSNAIKFCRSGDRITIAAAGEGNAPEICVRDTGPGIKPAMLADLFKFEKKTTTTGTAGETGTGFGLPLVKSIMDLHGGGLKVESEPGKGSVFSFTLPYVRPKILLVDDDRYSRYLQMQILRTLNADILEAENGEDALDMIADVRPSLVITDIKMPVMDGLELLKRIKGKPETRDIPVIVISGEYGMEVRDTVFKFGGDDFVTKSRIDTVDFFPRIRRFIG